MGNFGNDNAYPNIYYTCVQGMVQAESSSHTFLTVCTLQEESNALTLLPAAANAGVAEAPLVEPNLPQDPDEAAGHPHLVAVAFNADLHLVAPAAVPHSSNPLQAPQPAAHTPPHSAAAVSTELLEFSVQVPIKPPDRDDTAVSALTPEIESLPRAVATSTPDPARVACSRQAGGPGTMTAARVRRTRNLEARLHPSDPAIQQLQSHAPGITTAAAVAGKCLASPLGHSQPGDLNRPPDSLGHVHAVAGTSIRDTSALTLGPQPDRHGIAASHPLASQNPGEAAMRICPPPTQGAGNPQFIPAPDGACVLAAAGMIPLSRQVNNGAAGGTAGVLQASARQPNRLDDSQHGAPSPQPRAAAASTGQQWTVVKGRAPVSAFGVPAGSSHPAAAADCAGLPAPSATRAGKENSQQRTAKSSLPPELQQVNMRVAAARALCSAGGGAKGQGGAAVVGSISVHGEGGGECLDKGTAASAGSSLQAAPWMQHAHVLPLPQSPAPSTQSAAAAATFHPPPINKDPLPTDHKDDSDEVQKNNLYSAAKLVIEFLCPCRTGNELMVLERALYNVQELSPERVRKFMSSKYVILQYHYGEGHINMLCTMIKDLTGVPMH